MNPQFFCCCCRSLKQLVDCNLQQGVYKKKGSIVGTLRVFNRQSQRIIDYKAKQGRRPDFIEFSFVLLTYNRKLKKAGNSI